MLVHDLAVAGEAEPAAGAPEPHGPRLDWRGAWLTLAGVAWAGLLWAVGC